MKKVNELKTKNEELKNVVGNCESLDVALAKKDRGAYQSEYQCPRT